MVVVPGNPKGKQRPRMTKSGLVYTPKATKDAEMKIKVAYSMAAGGVPYPLEQPLKLILNVYYQLGQLKKKERQQALEAKIFPTKKPDIDNVAKLVMDSCTGVAYEDDRQVVELVCKKYYSTRPRIEFELIPIIIN